MSDEPVVYDKHYKEKRMAEQNTLLLLSDSLAKLHMLVDDKEINNMMQDKKYMELAQRMSEINRNANICSGIYFTMWMAIQQAEAKDNVNKSSVS